MRDDTWERLEAEFSSFPQLRGEEVAAAEIAVAASQLGLPLPDDYRDFVLRYGGGIVGAWPVYGLRPVEPMGNEWSVVEVNRRYRAEGWRGVDDWLIVSVDHAGNPIGIAKDGRVWVSDHDFGDVAVVAENFEGFLRNQCFQGR
jgi:hypothetical protein